MKFEKSYINRLYSGEIKVTEGIVPKTESYMDLKKQIDNAQKKLEAQISEAAYSEVIALMELLNLQSCEYGEMCFELGFKHSFRLISESICQSYSSEARTEFKKVMKLETEFITTLNAEQKKKYDELINLQRKLDAAFYDGHL